MPYLGLKITSPQPFLTKCLWFRLVRAPGWNWLAKSFKTPFLFSAKCLHINELEPWFKLVGKIPKSPKVFSTKCLCFKLVRAPNWNWLAEAFKTSNFFNQMSLFQLVREPSWNWSAVFLQISPFWPNKPQISWVQKKVNILSKSLLC